MLVIRITHEKRTINKVDVYKQFPEYTQNQQSFMFLPGQSRETLLTILGIK